MDAFAQQLVNGLTLGSLYALIAVGYTVVYGIVQLINFAHGEIFMIGAFGALSTWLIFFDGNTALYTLPFMIIGAIIASVTTAVLMERIAYRPLRQRPAARPAHHRDRHLGVPAGGRAALLRQDPVLRLPRRQAARRRSRRSTSSPARPSRSATSRSSASAIFTIGCLIMCAAGLWFFVNRTKTGRGMQAVSQDPDTARLMGINVDRIIVVAFAVGATLAAVAGVAQGLQVTNINFRMGFLAGLKAFTAAVLGGIGNVVGRRRRRPDPRARRGHGRRSSSRAPSVAARGRTSGRSASSSSSWSSGPRASSARRWWTGHDQAPFLGRGAHHARREVPSARHRRRRPDGRQRAALLVVRQPHPRRHLDPLLPGGHPALLDDVRCPRRSSSACCCCGDRRG